MLGLFSKPARIRVRLKKDAEVLDEPVTTVSSEEIIAERPVISVDQSEIMKTAENFLKEVCDKMGVEATFEITCGVEENRININIVGKDMGLLIGKRGQTLDALQYLTSLVVNKESGTYFKVKLDTENYRARRRETLENLARNLSSKVKKTKKSVALEPMNPYERRIIHSALQYDKFVETYSEGEEPNRKVVIAMKKEYRNYNGNRGGYNKKYNRNYKKNSYGHGGYEKRNFENKEVSTETDNTMAETSGE